MINRGDNIKEKIGFRVYLYREFNPSQEAIGTVALLDENGKQIDSRAYNHWDEIPQMMRRLLNKNKKNDDFFIRKIKK